MTSRERFRETMRYGAPDRVPYFEEGMRDEVLQRWRAEGIHDADHLARLFPSDRRERVEVDLAPRPALDRLPRTHAEVRELRRRLDASDPARLPADWPERARRWRDRDWVLELVVHHGFFLTMGVGDWRRFEEALYQLADSPDLVRAIMTAFAECSASLVERVLTDVDIDCASFQEPIGGNDRPLLSPRTYRSVVASTYRPIVEVLERGGVETRMLITYANARVLIPVVLETGINCLWACEVNTEAMDYLALRREFGRDLRLIGGIDLDTLLQSDEAIVREMEARVPPLLAQGGYIPLADGRVRADVPFARYACYRRCLERLATAGAAGAT